MRNKMDTEFKRILIEILSKGVIDSNPRPKYKNGEPAHSYSINHVSMSFDLSKNEFPILTLRPAPFKSSVGELLWIYQDASNDLKLLKDKYNINWWDQWSLDDNTIGACYGETVRRHDLMNNLLSGLKNNPDSRRHIINLWQVDDFKDEHALKPCCYQTVWNIRHEDDGNYLDMCMFQRSCDFMLAGSTSNQIQYAVFLLLVARHLGYKPGKYTWFAANVQIYSRHINNANIMLDRQPIICEPYVEINPEKTNFFDITVDDIKLCNYPIDEIKKVNPQLKFDIAI